MDALSGLLALLRGVWLLALAYFLGAIPFGYIIVKWRTGADVRFVESGRTGTTNTFRAAGWWAGLLTAVLDLLKGASAVWLAKFVFPQVPLIHVLAGVVAVIGHNHSIFTIERTPEGKIRIWGGAGGAPCVGGAMGLWPPAALVLVPIGAALWFFVGYASVATMTLPLTTTLLMATLSVMGRVPRAYVLYGILAHGPILWALRPNIRRLLNGTERAVGLRAWRQKRLTHRQPASSMGGNG